MRIRYAIAILIAKWAIAVCCMQGQPGRWQPYPICKDCRSPDLMVAPGVGFDLAHSYGTAAIRFENGTVTFVGKVDGDDDFKSLWERLSDWNSRPSNPNNDWERFQQNLERARRKLNKSLGLPATKEVGTIATLLLQLRQITEERLGSPITSAVISRPMLPGLTAQDLDDAMEYAGMKILSSYNCLGTYITSTSVAYAATNHGLCSNPADIESCEDEEVNMPYKFVLSVSFTNTALSFAFTTFRAAHLGYENIYRPYIYMGLDAQERYSGNKTRYWEAVGQRIRNFNSYLQRIDMVLVMGEAAGNEEFKRVLREALRDYRPPLGTEPVMIEDDYAMVDFELADVDEKGPEVLLALNASDKFDPLGLAARGAAEFAKRFQVMTWDCTEPAKCYRDEGAAQRLNSDL